VKKVKVTFQSERFWSDPEVDTSETGILFEDGHVIAIDQWGSIEIYRCAPTDDPNIVVVDRDKDGGFGLLEDNPDLFINLVLTGGAGQ